VYNYYFFLVPMDLSVKAKALLLGASFLIVRAFITFQYALAYLIFYFVFIGLHVFQFKKIITEIDSEHIY